MQETSSSLTARTSFRTAAKSTPPWLEEATAAAAHPQTPPRLQIKAHLPRPILPVPNPEVPGDESVSAVYSAAGCHYVAHGGRCTGRLGGLSPVAGFRPAAGRLSHDSGTNVLSRWQPGCNGVFGHR